MKLVKEIQLQNGMIALVDDEDYERCAEFNWTVSLGNEGSNLRVTRRDGKKDIALSRFILGFSIGDLPICFADGNQLNLRKSNLVVTSKKGQSLRGMGKRCTSSKYKGVSWDKRQSKWRANIKVNKKTKYLGSFENEVDAAEAYNLAAFKAWGNDCYLNVIGENNNAKTHVVKKSRVHRTKKACRMAATNDKREKNLLNDSGILPQQTEVTQR